MSRISVQSPWRRFYRTVVVPNPAAGADWRQTVPGSELWEIVSLFGVLVTSAAVPNRFAELPVGDGVTTFLTIPDQAGQAISLTFRRVWYVGHNNGGTNNLNRIVIPPLTLQPAESIGPVTNGLDVADQWSGVVIRALVTQFQAGEVDLLAAPSMTVLVVEPGAQS